MQCSGIGPHLMASWKSHDFFSSCARNLGYILELPRDDPSKPLFVQRRQDSCLVRRDTSGISTRPGRPIWMLLEVRGETKVPSLVATVILRFISIFRKSQPLSSFETLNSTCLSRCQRDVRPPVQMRRGSRVSLGSPQEYQTSLHLV